MRRWSLALAVALTTVPAVVYADEPIPQKARKLAEHGREMHEKGEYARAIVAFKEAYVMAPSPALLFNLAQAYRLQGNCDDAALMYRRYLAADPSPEARELAGGHLQSVERCVAKRSLDLQSDDSAAYLAVPPPPGPEHIIVADRREVDAPAPSHLKANIGLGVAIGGVAALGVAAYFGMRSYSASQAVEEAYASGAKWNEIEDIAERGERSERAATIFGIGGGLAAVGGVTLFLLGRRDERATPLAVRPSARGAEVSYAWRF
ncbi:MAG: hypothetical protein M3680_15245 [Myxococcota bacterium]|nr:hypothetical protein [Myxococcota bacterium]